MKACCAREKGALVEVSEVREDEEELIEEVHEVDLAIAIMLLGAVTIVMRVVHCWPLH